MNSIIKGFKMLITESSYINEICEDCDYTCNTIHFQQNFKNWTSGNSNIDKLIQGTQLSAHDNYDLLNVLEWIPSDRLYNIKYVSGKKMYRANWTDGCIYKWDNENENWKRVNQHMTVDLKSLNNSNNISLEFMNKVKLNYEFYGITQNPETKNYMMVLNNKCIECNYICNAVYFKLNFENWTSGNNDIDNFIQKTQLSAHNNLDLLNALEWIPSDRLYNIKYVSGKKMYRANWTDGCIYKWDNENENWKRVNQHMTVDLKSLNNSNNISLEFMNKNAITYVMQANWINGHTNEWNYLNQDWHRVNQNMIVILKNLNNSENITLEFMNEVKLNYEFYGITQNPETKNYMMVLNNKCIECNYICNAIYFKLNFENWTSGNNDIDKFIQETQLSAHHNLDLLNALEWIPYDRFYNVNYIAKGGFGKVYRANWVDGYIDKWNNETQNWKRNNKNMFVALKSLNNSKNITFEFINEITLHRKGKKHNAFIVGFYGITQDPETKNYIMVLEYAKDGSLRNYLDKRYHELNWENKVSYLQDIILGLKGIHEEELIHRDLHIGNILKLKYNTAITDMGLCKPADYNASENAKNSIYGILSYIAPEILRGQNYTKAADIYSFGIIMYEVISGLPPYYDLSHDKNLAIKICMGLRPRFNIKVPQLIVSLIKSCLDANPSNRPEVDYIYEMLKYDRTELQEQIKELEETNKNLPTSCISLNLGLSYKTHSEAIYTSRLLNFNDLPEQKNSDDYYEQNDNIISKEFSESLQIDISLNLDDNLFI
ncbi:kinase-like domain-containing protein [Rhizophagus diaphanus]|nr:kinase-like domain-containing protein [Rhizophagus diaphanus] [Rhizophagus sp. MUCL 43196]